MVWPPNNELQQYMMGPYEILCSAIGLYEQSLYNVTPCIHHKESPQIISTWLPEKIGGMPGKSVIFAETQVKLNTVI